MKRLISLSLTLLIILSACAPAQPDTSAELPDGALFAAAVTVYGMQKEYLQQTSGEFAPIVGTENLALSAPIPVYTWENGALQRSEQTRWLMLADGGVIGAFDWPLADDFAPPVPQSSACSVPAFSPIPRAALIAWARQPSRC